MLTILIQLSHSHSGWQVVDFSLALVPTSLLLALDGWFQWRRNLTIPRSPSTPAFNSFFTNRFTLDWLLGELGGLVACWWCFIRVFDDSDFVLPNMALLLLVSSGWDSDVWRNLDAVLWSILTDVRLFIVRYFLSLYAPGWTTGRRISRTCWIYTQPLLQVSIVCILVHIGNMRCQHIIIIHIVKNEEQNILLKFTHFATPTYATPTYATPTYCKATIITEAYRLLIN